jgi:acid phosphatase (class A)
MNKSLVVLVSLALVALIAGFALASQLAPAFVTPGEIDATDMLPPPPADDSAINKVEIAELHRVQDTRTAADIAQAQADADERDIFIFSTVIGKDFNAKALPLTAALSSHVEADQQADIEPVKEVFPRLRPYIFDKSLHPVCKATLKKDSYPSGHTMTGYLMALTLASMLPERRDVIFARADDYAHNRLVCGVHHPSDLESGKEIAYALFAVMADHPRFKAERAAATAEVRRALGLSAHAE